ncbi:AAA family ATPase [Streptomyces monticola]|uniref:AAA family ATPase n=1 Tax=Streptomyces monticola TaxID=2666263 RepID=A0ABW2JBE0_9ACTN
MNTHDAPEGHEEHTPLPLPVNSPDRRDGQVYVMTAELRMAVKVALATGRPLLLRGEPGSGKSSLAAYVAREHDWRYYEYVVTSRSKAEDLLWTYDHVRRLSDAQVRDPGTVLNDADYVTPGPLWWAYNPATAADGRKGRRKRKDPWARINKDRAPDHAVVLIDEIDKADPDLPNSLLVPLGSHQFTVTDTGERVRRQKGAERGGRKGHTAAGQHLIIITTNEERELPQAFLRRCVVMELPEPDRERLVDIAAEHFRHEHGGTEGFDQELAEALARELLDARKEARATDVRPPSTAEFLDALRACTSLGIGVTHDDWWLIRSLTLLKPQQPEA